MSNQPMNIRDPHALSAPYTVDPWYAADRPSPSPEGLSLFAQRMAGPSWSYYPGALEAYLLQRMVHDAFTTCVNVFHPGQFRGWAAVLHARCEITSTAIPDAPACRLYHNGITDVWINGHNVGHFAETSTPAPRSLDLRPYLHEGPNTITVRVHSLCAPPVFALLDLAEYGEASGWQVSQDWVRWTDCHQMPFVNATVFPHDEQLPAQMLAGQQVADELYDFGRELVGRPVITVEGDGEIVISPGESREEAQDLDPVNQEQYLLVLSVKTGTQQAPSQLALRYLRVVPGAGVRVTAVHVNASTYPVQYRGAFACADTTLTKIWQQAAYTLRLCMRELFLDGPKRDRLPWVGDLYLAGLCSYYSFLAPNVVRLTLQALRSSDPDLPDPNSIIDYSFYWVMALRDYALYVGELAFVRQAAADCTALLNTVEARTDHTGLIPSARCQWIFIDWAPLEKDGYSACLQMLYILALEAAADIAEMLGEGPRAGHYRAQADAVRQRCRVLFWAAEQQVYVDNALGETRGEHSSRHANLLAILSRTATPEQLPRLLENVLLNPAVTPVGTPYMKAFEARALAQCGRQAEMLALIRQYWGGMLDQGATTFWEAFDETETGPAQYAFYGRPYGRSLCHAWSAGPVMLLTRELFGLFPLAPGWTRCAFTPPRAIALPWVCAVIPTPQGDIRLDFADEQVSIVLPAGITLEYRDGDGAVQEYVGPCLVSR